ncbi:MAG: helix-turn-helix domain-containing protein [Clostridia bacterium]
MKIEILVKKVRLEKNMTLDTLAKLSGISKGHLSKIERQERDPKLSTIIQIASALKVEVSDLYKVIP